MFGAGARALAASQDDVDPASSTIGQSLRVLLGPGVAQNGPGDGFTFNGRRYRGSFSTAPSGEIINQVNIEAYLYSVVTREMPASWPLAALQAQATCARTYVLQRSSPRRDYDVVPSELDQVYGGIESESPAARLAVDATTGDVLRYAGDFAYAMYSSCCGGRTEASSDAWGGPPFAYLMGVACPYCSDSPDYRWQRSVALEQVASTFAQQLAALGALQIVRIGASDASGRAKTIELAAERGSAFVKGSAFRLAIGTRVVRSLLIEKLELDSAAAAPILAIEGGGLGHGVGLCQWGARGMALTGGSSRDILRCYFPGTEVTHD